jgi:hypothetical protein
MCAARQACQQRQIANAQADRAGARPALHKTVAARAKKTYRDEIMAFAGVTTAA